MGVVLPELPVPDIWFLRLAGMLNELLVNVSLVLLLVLAGGCDIDVI